MSVVEAIAAEPIFSARALAGRTILVTGASSGLGQAAAVMIAQCGGRVIALGRDAGRLDETLQALASRDHRTAIGSLTTVDEAAELVTRLAGEVGGLDGVFHAAGTELVLPIRLTKIKHVEAVFGAAVNGAFGIARAVGKTGVMRDGGALVMMSSAAAQRGTAGMAVYSAAKAATDGMVRSLACEFAPRRIRVNAIAAGGVETAMHARLTRALPAAALADFANAHPLGFGQAQDVANVAVFLLSAASAWVTGAVWAVDGGYSAA